MSEQRTILCVLSEDQRAEYQSELAGLRKPGIELVMRDDAEAALVEAGTLDPQLVIVGMELGPMEGLEFLAFFMKRYPDYDRSIVVLPSKDDPFPPMAHSRNPGSGRSEADEVGFHNMLDLLPGVAATAPTPAPPALTTPEPAPSPSPGPPPAQPAAVLQPTVTEPQAKKGWVIPVIAVAAVVVIGGGVFLMFSGGGEDSSTPRDPATKKADTPDTPDKPVQPDEKKSPQDPPEDQKEDQKDEPKAVPTPDTPDTPDTPPPARPTRDMTKLTTLPFTFQRSSSEPVLTDEAELRSLLDALAEAKQRVEVGGHTSNEGKETYNRELGWNRAEKVRNLLAKRGIPRKRLIIKSYGGKSPAASNNTEQGREKNRRVTVRLRP